MFSKGLVIIFCFLFVFSLPVSRSTLNLFNQGIPVKNLEAESAVARQIVVKAVSGQSGIPRLLKRRYGQYINTIHSHFGTGYLIMDTVPGCDRNALMESLRTDSLISDVSLNYVASITGTLPDDPYFSFQYALLNEGQVYYPAENMNGSSGSDIRAPEGWDWSIGSRDVVIAVLDTGVAGDHEDLADKLHDGYNFIDDSTDTSDDNGHGTFVASIAGADTDNSTGMAGVSWNCLIMPVKVLDSQGLGDYLTIAAGIRFAADQGAQVLNLSFGGANDSFILRDACCYAFEKGCVLVASTGNDAGDVLYPARYNSYCLAVGATGDDDLIAEWSNYGPQVDVAAPGEYVFGAVYLPDEPDQCNLYGWGSGTSFAAPYVSGAAALLISAKSFLTSTQIMSLIRYTADDANESYYPGFDIFMGYGRINLVTLLGPYPLN